MIERALYLLSKASQRPWEIKYHGSRLHIESVDKSRGMRPAGDPYPQIAKMAADYSTDLYNAEFFVAAPELVEWLCGEVRRLQEDDLNKEFARCHSCSGKGVVAVSPKGMTTSRCFSCNGAGTVRKT